MSKHYQRSDTSWQADQAEAALSAAAAEAAVAPTDIGPSAPHQSRGRAQIGRILRRKQETKKLKPFIGRQWQLPARPPQHLEPRLFKDTADNERIERILRGDMTYGIRIRRQERRPRRQKQPRQRQAPPVNINPRRGKAQQRGLGPRFRESTVQHRQLRLVIPKE